MSYSKKSLQEKEGVLTPKLLRCFIGQNGHFAIENGTHTHKIPTTNKIRLKKKKKNFFFFFLKIVFY